MGFGALPDGCLDLGLSCHGRREMIKNNNHSNKSLFSFNYDPSFPSLSLGLIPPPQQQQQDGHDHPTGGGGVFLPKIEVENLQASSPLSTTAVSTSFSSVKKERDYYSGGRKGRGGGGGDRDGAAEGSGEERFLVLSASRNSTTTDEDEEGSPRKKLRLTKDQSALLEESFKEHSTLNPKQKQALADQLNLRPRQVEVWFQNRRARTKLKQTEVDCELLKKCCETLTEENKRLHKELQDLRSMKLQAAAAPPSYMMQMPAATLSMCPSCERTTAADATNDNNIPLRSMNGVVPKGYFYNPAAFSHSPSAAC
ncbi:unnamed protein product [Linum tenue]|uniref:Homeobox domain-containing protein n=1 Tax=Linum tenue TaxID=586396 RepID=A0AAV0P174_9ROSI|nr:unnamed protein product [Linum tenue]